MLSLEKQDTPASQIFVWGEDILHAGEFIRELLQGHRNCSLYLRSKISDAAKALITDPISKPDLIRFKLIEQLNGFVRDKKLDPAFFEGVDFSEETTELLTEKFDEKSLTKEKKKSCFGETDYCWKGHTQANFGLLCLIPKNIGRASKCEIAETTSGCR